MSSENSTKIPIANWSPPEPTKYPLDYAELTNIDMSLLKQPGGKEKLVDIIRHALTDVGFWIVTNHTFSVEEVQRQFALGQTFFEQPLEERQKYPMDGPKGDYLGYRAAYERTIYGTDVKDNMELLNIAKFSKDFEDRPRHRVIRENEAVISDFSRRCWYEVAKPLFELFALALELPEDYFVERHHYEKSCQDHLRYMMYHPRSKEEDEKVKNLWAWPHTDYGSLTLLFSQTVSGLEIMMPDGSFKAVKPLEGSIVVNVADTLSFMTKGYLKSTIHRVHRPPPDQDHIHRVGVIYMARPNDNTIVRPAPSPLLRRLGLVTDEEEAEADKAGVKAGEYIAARVKAVHGSTTYGFAPGEKFKHKNLEILENYTKPAEGAAAPAPSAAPAVAAAA